MRVFQSLALLALTLSANAADVTVTWDYDTPELINGFTVTITDISNSDSISSTVGNTATSSTFKDINRGDYLASVIAEDDHGASEAATKEFSVFGRPVSPILVGVEIKKVTVREVVETIEEKYRVD